MIISTEDSAMKEEITLAYLKRTDMALSKILNSLAEGGFIAPPDCEVTFWNHKNAFGSAAL